VKLFYGLRAAILFSAGIFITFSADHGYLIGQQLLTAVTGAMAIAGLLMIAAKREIARADLLLVILAFLVTIGSFFTISAPELSLYFHRAIRNAAPRIQDSGRPGALLEWNVFGSDWCATTCAT
jgi:hypothetical protein